MFGNRNRDPRMADPCAGCCNMCCPSPKNCIVPRTGPAQTASSILCFLTFLDLIGSIMRMVLMDWMSGLFFLINVWIIYISYATLNWCQLTIVGITAIIDLAQVGMLWGQLSAYFGDYPEYKTILILFMVAAGIKFISSIIAYVLLKQAMAQHYGRNDCQMAMTAQPAHGRTDDSQGGFSNYGRGGQRGYGRGGGGHSSSDDDHYHGNQRHQNRYQGSREPQRLGGSHGGADYGHGNDGGYGRYDGGYGGGGYGGGHNQQNNTGGYYAQQPNRQQQNQVPVGMPIHQNAQTGNYQDYGGYDSTPMQPQSQQPQYAPFMPNSGQGVPNQNMGVGTPVMPQQQQQQRPNSSAFEEERRQAVLRRFNQL